MLTKDLLTYKITGDSVVPRLLKPDVRTTALAVQILTLFQDAKGKTLLELTDALAEVTASMHKVKLGLEKLLTDRCTLSENSTFCEEQRWQVFSAAEALRLEADLPSYAAYVEALSKKLSRCPLEIEGYLYADLPDCRTIETFAEIDTDSLIHRYNCAQIQGLILKANKLKIVVEALSLAQRRALFRALKFHQLLIDGIIEQSGSIEFNLSGPLSIFDKSQAYGIKMANFFPYLLELPRFRLEADIRLEGRGYQLLVTEKLGLRGHYRPLSGFVPSELVSCIDLFNEKFAPLKARVSEDFLNLGRQSYCFPDLVIDHAKAKKTIYIELFHRWHAGGLRSRLQALAGQPHPNLKIGVSSSIADKPELKALLEESPWYQQHGFRFREFPTPKQLFALSE